MVHQSEYRDGDPTRSLQQGYHKKPTRYTRHKYTVLYCCTYTRHITLYKKGEIYTCPTRGPRTTGCTDMCLFLNQPKLLFSCFCFVILVWLWNGGHRQDRFFSWFAAKYIQPTQVTSNSCRPPHIIQRHKLIASSASRVGDAIISQDQPTLSCRTAVVNRSTHLSSAV